MKRLFLLIVILTSIIASPIISSAQAQEGGGEEICIFEYAVVWVNPETGEEFEVLKSNLVLESVEGEYVFVLANTEGDWEVYIPNEETKELESYTTPGLIFFSNGEPLEVQAWREEFVVDGLIITRETGEEVVDVSVGATDIICGAREELVQQARDEYQNAINSLDTGDNIPPPLLYQP